MEMNRTNMQNGSAVSKPCSPCQKKKSMLVQRRPIAMQGQNTPGVSGLGSRVLNSTSNTGNRTLNPAMPRSNFIRTAGLGAAALGAAAVGLGSRVNAIGGDEPWDNKVYPTQDAYTNWKNIQEAVNRGGTVRLMHNRSMPFDLRGQEAIVISRDVKIIGQNTKLVASGTVFSCQAAVRLSFANLHFSMTDRQNTPFNFTRPANNGDIALSIMSVTIGDDDPWD